jgi:signal transduction histidine kinase
MLDAMAHRRRIGMPDVAVAAAFGAVGLFLTFGHVDDNNVNANLLGVALVIPLAAAMLWRRTAPVAALGGLLVVVVALDLALGVDVVRCLFVPPMTLLLVFSAAKRCDRGEAIAALALGIALIVAEGLSTYGGFAVVLVPLATVVWGIGRFARSRRALIEQLEERTAELRTARDERARIKVASERARLSAELDRLLQRRLGELASLSADGSRPRDAAAATATLAEIEDKSRDTLEQMRALVGVLRNDDGGAPLTPQPTLTSLAALLTRKKGTDARLTVEGSPHALPPSIELSAYRIVEHLLEALDDAPGVTVQVSFRDDALDIKVSGPARRRADAPIERARARAELHHGSLDATRRGRRAEAIASLPLLVAT